MFGVGKEFAITKKIEAILNRVAVLRRTGCQLPDLLIQTAQVVASLSQVAEAELSKLPSTALPEGQLAMAANGTLTDFVEAIKKLGLPELLDPARFPILKTLSPESLALLRSEALIRLITRLLEIKGEINKNAKAIGFTQESSVGIITSLENRIAACREELQRLNQSN